ncbi:MAG: hypothetical protein E6J61_12635 [Deltaproteobacteria bacterium]|nr:MAG: hypothetical protein E6J61_12635 [Deltaproteobacteria bacterium]
MPFKACQIANYSGSAKPCTGAEGEDCRRLSGVDLSGEKTPGNQPARRVFHHASDDAQALLARKERLVRLVLHDVRRKPSVLVRSNVRRVGEDGIVPAMRGHRDAG